METITLGGVDVNVVAQRHAYVSRCIGPAFASVVAKSQDVSAEITGIEQVLDFAGESAYDLLIVLIPSLEKGIPKWQFMGFASQAAMDAGDYDRHADDSPTYPEIVNAFAVGLRVNGIDKLGKVIDPAYLRAQLNMLIATALSTSSATSPSTNGTSPSTSSGTTPPASTENTDSPSLESTA
jgi:hypothetical protein